MKSLLHASITAAFAACLLGATAARAEECPRDPNAGNSAFATPRPCPTAKPAVKPKPASGVEKTTTPDGKTVIRTPDTELTVSGFVEGTVSVKSRQ